MRAVAWVALGAVLLTAAACGPLSTSEAAELGTVPADARWAAPSTKPAPDGGSPDAGVPTPGAARWARGFNSSAVATPSALAVSSKGILLLATSFETGSAELGGELFLNMGDGDAADADLALARYTPDGAHVWSQKFGAHGGVSSPPQRRSCPRARRRWSASRPRRGPSATRSCHQAAS